MKVITKEKGQYESSDPLFLQQGGQADSGVYGGNYRPLTFGQSGTTTADKKTKSDSTNDKSGKGLMDQITGKGITNDVYANAQKLMEIQNAYDNMSDAEKTSNQGIMMLQQMQFQSGKVTELLRSADAFKNAQQQVVKQEALGETAISGNGFILQGPNGKIVQISPEEYVSLSKEEKAQYKPLTNAQLIQAREYDMPLQGDTESFTQLNNSTSLQVIQKDLQAIMASITSSKKAQSYDQYTDPSGKLIEGLQQLKSLSDKPIDNILVDISEDSNESSAQDALQAMWSSLNDNGRTLLKTKAALQGYSQDQLEDVAKGYLIQLLKPRISKSSDVSQKIDFGPKEKDGSGKDDGLGSGKGDVMQYWDVFQNDKAPDRKYVEFAPEGTGIQFSAPAAVYGPMVNKEQKPYTSITLGDIPQLSAVTQKNSASLGGDMALNNSLQQGIAYNGDALYRVLLPYKVDPTTKDITPNFDLLPAYEAQMKEIDVLKKKGKTLTTGEKMNIFKKHKITDLNVNGEPNQVKDFQVTQVYVTEYLYDLLDEKSKSFLTEQDDEGTKSIMQETYKSKEKEGIWDGDDVYRGLVYLPINESAGVMSQVSDGGIKSGTLEQRRYDYQERTGQINRARTQVWNADALNEYYGGK